jgi:hypothetical protein
MSIKPAKTKSAHVAKNNDTALERWWENYLPELDKIADDACLILKIHIAVEDALTHLLAMKLKTTDEYIRKVKLGFDRLLKLALSTEQERPLQKALNTLNDVRNLAAHRFQRDRFLASLNDFLKMLAKVATNELDLDQKDRLQLLREAGAQAVSEVFFIAAPYW